MYQIILIGILFLITIYLLYQNYTIHKEIFKIKNSFDELNNFLDLSIKKTKPKVLDTLSEINTTSITDNIITYSNDVRRVKEDSSNTSDNNQKLINNIMNKLDKDNNDIDLKNEVDDCESDDECDDECDDDCEDDSEIVDSEIDNTSTIEDECEDLEKIEFFNKEDNNLTSVIENIKSSISNSLNNEQISEKLDDLNQPIDQSDDKQIDIPKNQHEDQSINQLEDQSINQLEDQQINQPVDQPINENINIRETYTVDDLKKMTIIKIKDIARKFKIILSISGKSKTKDQLIQNIIELKN
uniref:Uncharacterized protein n=1 Tax=viral metagenome TaxID=1070528 RepID=A0A6C0H164_9ZZZZ